MVISNSAAPFPAGMGHASIRVKFSLKDLAAGFEGTCEL
jgi:hypothetical protein